MAYLQSNIPHFHCWVRKEFTHNREKYRGEYLHGMAIAVTTIPDRCLSFQIVFTGCESDDTDDEVVIGIDQDGGDHEFNHDEVDTILIF